jgi:hypothetical protein
MGGGISPERLLDFAAKGLVIVAALGTGMVWLRAHVSPNAAYLVAAALLVASFIAVFGLIVFGGRNKLIEQWAKVSAVIGVGTLIALALTWWLAGSSDFYYVMAYVFAGGAVVPFVWLLYRIDADAHKPCDQCHECVKAPAKVCRYCGWHFTQETYRPSGARSRPPD